MTVDEDIEIVFDSSTPLLQPETSGRSFRPKDKSLNYPPPPRTEFESFPLPPITQRLPQRSYDSSRKENDLPPILTPISSRSAKITDYFHETMTKTRSMSENTPVTRRDRVMDNKKRRSEVVVDCKRRKMVEDDVIVLDDVGDNNGNRNREEVEQVGEQTFRTFHPMVSPSKLQPEVICLDSSRDDDSDDEISITPTKKNAIPPPVNQVPAPPAKTSMLRALLQQPPPPRVDGDIIRVPTNVDGFYLQVPTNGRCCDQHAVRATYRGSCDNRGQSPDSTSSDEVTVVEAQRQPVPRIPVPRIQLRASSSTSNSSAPSEASSTSRLDSQFKDLNVTPVNSKKRVLTRRASKQRLSTSSSVDAPRCSRESSSSFEPSSSTEQSVDSLETEGYCTGSQRSSVYIMDENVMESDDDEPINLDDSSDNSVNVNTSTLTAIDTEKTPTANTSGTPMASTRTLRSTRSKSCLTLSNIRQPEENTTTPRVSPLLSPTMPVKKFYSSLPTTSSETTKTAEVTSNDPTTADEQIKEVLPPRNKSVVTTQPPKKKRGRPKKVHQEPRPSSSSSTSSSSTSESSSSSTSEGSSGRAGSEPSSTGGLDAQLNNLQVEDRQNAETTRPKRIVKPQRSQSTISPREAQKQQNRKWGKSLKPQELTPVEVVCTTPSVYNAVVDNDQKYEEEFVVSRIMDCTYDRRGKEVYAVAWLNWNYTTCTYQPIEDLDNSPVALSEYYVKEEGLKAVIEVLKTVQCPKKTIFKRERVKADIKPMSDDDLKALWENGPNNVQKSHKYWKIKRLELDWLSVLRPTDGPLYIEGWTLSAKMKLPKFEFIVENIFSDKAKEVIEEARNNKPCTCTCHCAGICDTCQQKFYQRGQRCVWNDDNTLSVADGSSFSTQSLYFSFICSSKQCGDACPPDASCRTRPHPLQRTFPLLVFFEPRVDGWTIRALTDIKKGQFVSDYIGKVITGEESEETSCSYQFTIGLDEKLVIDSIDYGNESRFFSHSCDPNMVSVELYSEGFIGFYHKIIFVTSKDVKAGEELTFDYHPNNAPRPRSGYASCSCGSEKCRGWV